MKYFKISKNLSSLIVVQWFQYAAAFILMPHLISSLGVGNYGVLIVAQAWLALISIIVEYGFSLIGVSEVSKNKNNPLSLKRIFWSVTLCRIIIFISLYLLILMFTFANFSSSSFWVIFSIVSISAFGVAIDAQWFFLGRQESHHIIKWSMTIKILVLLTNFILVRDEHDLVLAAILYVLGYVLPGMYTFLTVLVRRKIGKPSVSFKEISSMFLQATPFLTGRFANMGINQTTLIVSSLIFLPAQVAVLSVTVKVLQVCSMIYAPLQQHLLAKMSNEFSVKVIKKYAVYCMTFSLVQVIVLYISSPYLSVFLLGQTDELFMGILTYCSFIIPISIMYMFFGAPLMIPLEESKRFNQSILLSFMSHLLIIIVFYLLSIGNYEISLLMFAVFVFPISKLLALTIRFYYLIPIKDKF